MKFFLLLMLPFSLFLYACSVENLKNSTACSFCSGNENPCLACQQRQNACHDYLATTGKFLVEYQRRNDGRLPSSLEALREISADFPFFFICNDGNLPRCPYGRHGQARTLCSACMPFDSNSYYYVGGLDLVAAAKDTPVMFDRIGNHDGYVNVLFADAHQEIVKAAPSVLLVVKDIAKNHNLGAEDENRVGTQAVAMEKLYTMRTGSKNDTVLAEALAKANRLPDNSVYVNTSHFKANYFNIQFRILPPNGQYDIAPIINAVKHAKSGSPVFLHIIVPGGNLTPFLNLAQDNLCLEKVGKHDINFDVIQKTKVKHFDTLELKCLTMADIMRLPENFNVRILDVELPRNQKFDWLLLLRFPQLECLRLSGAAGFINAGQIERVDCSLVFRGCENLDLPKRLNCDLLSLEQMDFNASIFDRLDPEKISSLHFRDCRNMKLDNLKRFVNCCRIELENCRDIHSLVPFAGMPKLESLTINFGEINDVSGIKDIPQLRILYLYQSGLSEFSSLKGCRLWSCTVTGWLEKVIPKPEEIAGIEHFYCGENHYIFGELQK